MCPKSSLLSHKASQKYPPTLLPEPKHQQKNHGWKHAYSELNKFNMSKANPLGLQIPRCFFFHVYQPWGRGQHQKAGPVHDPLLFRALFQPPAGEVVGTCLANGHIVAGYGEASYRRPKGKLKHPVVTTKRASTHISEDELHKLHLFWMNGNDSLSWAEIRWFWDHSLYQPSFQIILHRPSHGGTPA